MSQNELRPQMLDLDFSNQTANRIEPEDINKHLELVLHRLNYTGNVKIEISLEGDKAIKTINAKHRQVDEPTDVLSLENPFYITNNQQPLGSIVVSTETATRQAKEAGIPLTDEVEMLSGHGLLHLLGYHHK